MARREVPMSFRRAIVEAEPAALNVAEFCRGHGVSTWFFWDLRRRYALEGDLAFEPKSRAPHRPAGRTPLRSEKRSCGPVKSSPTPAGTAARPRSRSPCGSRRGASGATIWRILTTRGLIVLTRRKPRSTPGAVSLPNGPTSAGRSMTGPGPSLTAPACRSSMSSTITAATPWPAPPWRPAPGRPPSTPSLTPPLHSDGRNGSGPTTPPPSPAPSPPPWPPSA